MKSEKLRVKSEEFATAIVLFLLTLFSGCKDGDTVTEIVPARHWVEKTVAVVAPIGDAATKARLERTADCSCRTSARRRCTIRWPSTSR